MIRIGNSDATAIVAEHEQSLLNFKSSGDSDIDRFSVSAKRAFLESYEHLFDQFNVPYNKTSSL